MGADKTTLNIRLLNRQARRAEHRDGPKAPTDHWRPRTRGECLPLPRPCPYVGCRYHLFLDVDHRGSIHMPFGTNVDVLAQMPETCCLDVAEKGGVTLDEVGRDLAVTRERVRQVEQNLLHAMRRETDGPLSEFYEERAKRLEE